MIASELLSALRRHWLPAIAGVAGIALVIALVLTRLDASRWQDVAGRRQQALADEQAAHKVTRASVTTLQSAIARQNADVQARADAIDAARRQSADAEAAADARWRATADQVARLKAIASRPAAGCTAPADLLDALKGY